LRARKATYIMAASIAAALAVGTLAGCASGVPGQPSRSASRDTSFTAQDWHVLDADPEAHKGARVSFVGKVFSPFEAQQIPPNIQVFVNPVDASGVAVVTVAKDPGVKIGEYVAVEGTVLGRFEGTGPFSGADVTAVLVQASSIQPTATPTSPGSGD
jgi:hypothetical protein